MRLTAMGKASASQPPELRKKGMETRAAVSKPRISPSAPDSKREVGTGLARSAIPRAMARVR